MCANLLNILNAPLLQVSLNEPLDEAYNECPGNGAEMQRYSTKWIIQKMHSCLNWHFKCHFNHLIYNFKASSFLNSIFTRALSILTCIAG